MDKKSIIAIVILAVVIIFYWPILTKMGFIDEPAPAEMVDTVKVTTPQPTPTIPQTPAVQAESAPDQTVELVITQPDTTTIDTIIVETEKYRVMLSSHGGGPISLLLKDYSYRDGEWIEMLPNTTKAVPEATFGGGTFSTSDLHYSCDRMPGTYYVNNDPLKLVYTYTIPNGGVLERQFTFYPDSHHYDLKLSVNDPSLFGFDREYRLGWNNPLAPTEPDLDSDWKAMQLAAMIGNSREALDDFNDGRMRQSVDGQVAWAGVRSKYFAAVLLPQSRPAVGAFAEGEERDVMTDDGGMMEERHITGGISMQFTALSPIVDSFTVFVGPLDYMMMSDYHAGLQDMLDIGTTRYVGWIIKPFAIAVMWIMPKMYNVIPNYGLVIILFALMVKIVTLPLSMKQFKSMQAMKEIQPKMDELKLRHKKDPKALNTEMMKLYKTHGVNPMSGCLPLLPQMPLFFALFSVFRSTILLRDAPFIWFIDDLSRGASGLTDPYIILVVLMIASQFMSQKLTMPTSSQNKMLGYMMPLFMGFIFYKFAAGLVLYWTCFSTFAMLDYVIFKRPKKNPEVKAA